MIKNLSCGCALKSLQPDVNSIESEILKGNVVFFDSPSRQVFGHIFYRRFFVVGDLNRYSDDETERLVWTLSMFRDVVNQLILDGFEFSYANADISYSAELNATLIKFQ